MPDPIKDLRFRTEVLIPGCDPYSPTVDVDGYIGVIDPGAKIALEIKFDSQELVFPYQNKGRLLGIQWSKVYSGNVVRLVFEVLKGKSEAYVRLPNSFKIARVYGDILEWCYAGIAVQNGRFFAIRMLDRSGQIYRLADGLHCTNAYLNDSIKLMEALNDKLRAEDYDSISTLQNPLEFVEDYPMPILDSDQACVKWYDLVRGMGILSTPQGDARVDWQDITDEDPNAFKYLVAGETCEYGYLEPNQKAKSNKFAPPYIAREVVLVNG